MMTATSSTEYPSSQRCSAGSRCCSENMAVVGQARCGRVGAVAVNRRESAVAVSVPAPSTGKSAGAVSAPAPSTGRSAMAVSVPAPSTGRGAGPVAVPAPSTGRSAVAVSVARWRRGRPSVGKQVRGGGTVGELARGTGLDGRLADGEAGRGGSGNRNGHMGAQVADPLRKKRKGGPRLSSEIRHQIARPNIHVKAYLSTRVIRLYCFTTHGGAAGLCA